MTKMMKRLATAALCLQTALMPVTADTGNIVLYGLQDYTVTAVSPNGLWATGYFMNASGAYFAFRWDLTTNQTELLSGGDAMSMAYGVANDGTVVGEYTDYTAYDNGAGAMVAGYHNQGQWHALPGPGGEGTMAIGGSAQCISADGQWMGGQAGSAYQPVVWQGGAFHKAMSTRAGNVYAISNDGAMAAGWAYRDANETRFTALWQVESAQATWLSQRGNPYNCGRMLTQDAQHLLNFSDQWAYVYDVASETNNKVAFCTSALWNLQVYCIDDSLRVYSLETNMDQQSYGSVSKGQEAKTLTSYLSDLGVDYSHLDVARIVTINACSANGQVLSAQTISNDGYEHPMMILLGQNISTREPVALTAQQPEGVFATKLSWSEPINQPQNLSGYNVYRDGVKVNDEPITSTQYIDANLEASTYTYAVSAVYGQDESAMSQSTTITLLPPAIQAPRSLYARQKGYNSAALTWSRPGTNRVDKRYYNPEGNISAMGGGSNSFECAIRYSHHEMALYKGYSISHVAFVPQSAQTAWKLKIYSGSTLVYEQPITQTLTYGHENIVALDTPVQIDNLTDDVYCAIAVTVPSTTESNNVIGADFDHCVPGYSDLIHLDSEAQFYSLSEASRANSYVFDLAFAMSMILSAPGQDDSIDIIDRYNVFMDGALLGSTADNSYVEKDVANGQHQLEVQAVYADGRQSAPVATQLSIEANSSALAVNNVTCQGDANGNATFSWQAPADDDQQTIAYCADTYGQAIAYGAAGMFYRARSVYPASMTRGLQGYVIKQLRFYPTDNAIYTLMLHKDGVQVAEIPVEDYQVNQWNTITLDTPIAIEEGAQYALDVDCFDGSEDGGALAIDNQPTVSTNAVLSSTDDGATFAALTGTGNGNWMMGMVVADPNGKPLDIDGYNLRIDNQTVNTSIITDCHYTYAFGNDANQSTIHRVYVDAIYTLYGEVRGKAVFFTLQELANGIEHTMVADLRLHQGVGYVAVEGDNVHEICAYGLDGTLMGRANGSLLDVSTYANGLYIIKVKTGGQTITAKMRVVR